MLKNYLKIASRNLIKTRQYTVINILGLSIGMAACLLILHYVFFEKSYDKIFATSERIYRLRYERTSETGETVHFSSCCPPLGLRIRKLLPEVEKVGRIWRYTASVSNKEKKFIEERMFFAEPEFFEVFNYEFIAGNPVVDLREPGHAFISESTAKKYFGDENPIGNSISVDKKTEYKVSGIFKDIPQNSHLKFDIILSWANLLAIYGPDVEESWGDTGAYTYLLFKKGANIAGFETKLAELVNNEIGELIKEYKTKFEFPIQKVTDIHLTSHYQQEYEVNGDKDTVNFLYIIAIFIIVIAWVNYINLSTARSLTRAREVGLRKVVGASRIRLISQFLVEIVIINLFAVVLAWLLVELLMPIFADMTSIPTSYSIWKFGWFWIAISVMFFAGILLSGLYPIIILSSYRPIEVLKGKLGNKSKGVNLRKILVVFQFTMALLLLTFTFAVFKQITFMKNQNLGFSTKQIMAIRIPRVRNAPFKSQMNSFREELVKNPEIEKFCVLTETPGKQIYWDAGGIHPVGNGIDKNYQIVGIDYDFVDVFQTKIIEGRNFSKDFPSDTASLILNETAVRWMDFPDSKSAVGKQVSYWGQIFIIVGVMKDYHQQSPKAAFEPHIYRLMPYGRGVRGYFAIKLSTSNASKNIKMIQQKYTNFFPDNPFEFYFLDDYFNKQYKSDEIVGKVFGTFSFLAILVTAMGILGLFSFMVIQRTKEISIRNVLGAGTSRILYLFAMDFIRLIMISFIIAIPLSYFGVVRWLESFSLKMEVGVSIFILPLLIVLIVAGLTIISQVLKAARANPIDNLRYE
jgi:putative ABC transport system permease protein